ncbi:MAG: sigma-70 family RNA polymerase sigma factor [Betaproteobacteria bacterium]|nr:sigma-70 family RNA polymerase sigma factor [Betaproteobacteria bacterium]
MNRPSPETDAQAAELAALLAQCGLGKQDAFAALYRATSAKLYGLAIRILRREDWAEEVLQEAYVNIWNHAADYAAAKSAPLTWMASIVRNRCIDWLRRPQRELGGEQSEFTIESREDEAPGPLEQALAAGEAGALARCLERLEGDQRRAIQLAFYHGLTHPEVAAKMKRPVGTVKTWIRRGLMQLKGCLDSGDHQ